MKILIVYYSRTGITRNVSNILKEKLNADIEEIDDGNKYKGPIGYLKGGINAVTGRMNDIKPLSKNPADYDLTIIGSPVWGSHLAPGVSTFIMRNSKEIKNVAGFVTCGSSGGEKTLSQISEECGKKLQASLILTSEDIENNLEEKINTFINEL